MNLNTWGPSRHLQAEFEQSAYPCLARVMSALNVQVIQVQGTDEPARAALGRSGEPKASPDATQRVTPYFFSLEALDYFCEQNWRHFAMLTGVDNLPRRWFWHQ